MKLQEVINHVNPFQYSNSFYNRIKSMNVPDEEQKGTSRKFVRGAFLYMDKGEGYKEGHEGSNGGQEKIVKDTLGIYEYHKQLKQKKLEAENKKKQQGNKLGDRPSLIPIRDTPVEPLPQPVIVYQKCERSSQEQFEFFQSYVNLKQKEKQFQDQQQRQIAQFLQKQRKLRENIVQNPPQNDFQVVMEKEEPDKLKKTKKIMKIKIKKKQE